VSRKNATVSSVDSRRKNCYRNRSGNDCGSGGDTEGTRSENARGQCHKNKICIQICENCQRLEKMAGRNRRPGKIRCRFQKEGLRTKTGFPKSGSENHD